ncbi:uncharacterized protein LOC118205646 isoform X2 [Stegodyphus dumicola]|nr:uncharacterized protein LOC118205646 isoform X2 [Stegodyphus dumicola]
MEGVSSREEKILSFNDMTSCLESLDDNSTCNREKETKITELPSYSFKCDLQLPSTVTDQNYIYFPKDTYAIDKYDVKSGKWMLFAYGDLEEQDWRWTILQPLVKEGILSSLKASTAMDSEKGVICCYTVDSDDKLAAKKAADAIREIILYKYIMYYKTNEDSAAGVYIHEGHFQISKYMHTVNSHFYEKDEYNRWVKVVSDS